jgi:hypothetical protein
MQVFSDRLENTFNSFFVGFAGFIFLPYTTVLYAICYEPNKGVSGIGWLLVIFGFILDMGSWFGGGQQAKQRQNSTPSAA